MINMDCLGAHDCMLDAEFRGKAPADINCEGCSCFVDKNGPSCPDCGSHNIEIVDGPIMQCEANHSGECQDCFTAWTID